jgi:hypothetical protein
MTGAARLGFQRGEKAQTKTAGGTKTACGFLRKLLAAYLHGESHKTRRPCKAKIIEAGVLSVHGRHSSKQ